MDIDNLDSITYTVEDDGTMLTITFTDPVGAVELGHIRIAKAKARPFFESLLSIGRAVHNVFQVHENTTTTLSNKTQGAINFR